MMTGGFSSLSTTLSQPTAIGAGYDSAPTGLVFGGGGGALISRVWVGGKGFGLYVDSVNTSRGTTTLTGGGGGGELGYAVIANQHWLIVPFFGAGAFGYSLTVQNATNGPMPIPGQTIAANGEGKYTAKFITGELGIRASRLILWGNAGIMVGAEVGYMSSLQRAAWEGENGSAPPESAELRGGYFRLLIGGGGFSFREKQEPAHHPE